MGADDVAQTGTGDKAEMGGHVNRPTATGRTAWSRWLPASLYGPPRRILTPTMAGRSTSPQVALTIDDGPDPASTPTILDTLSKFGVRATFFVVGEHAVAHPELLRRAVDEGHELAVHGWTHRNVFSLSSTELDIDLDRASEVVSRIGGTAPRWYRPPFGITNLAAHDAARAAGMQTVLWTSWGRDWSRWVSPRGIVWRVERTLRPGGTVLLHDSDRYASTGSWRRTDEALHTLLRTWLDAGIDVGPLRDHGLADRVTSNRAVG